MDINDLRSAFTVLAILMFVGIVWWAYSDRRQQAFDEAARLPLEDDAPAGASDATGNARVTQNIERKSS